MDYHRKPGKQDTRNARPCAYCQQTDNDFLQRRSSDQMVVCGLRDVASAHLTEEGFLRHRMLELRILAARLGTPILFDPSVAA